MLLSLLDFRLLLQYFWTRFNQIWVHNPRISRASAQLFVQQGCLSSVSARLCENLWAHVYLPPYAAKFPAIAGFWAHVAAQDIYCTTQRKVKHLRRAQVAHSAHFVKLDPQPDGDFKPLKLQQNLNHLVANLPWIDFGSYEVFFFPWR